MPSTQAYKTKKRTLYMARWTDSAGNRKSERGFTARKAAQEYAEEMQLQARRVRSGLESPAEQRRIKAAARKLSDHLDDYIEATQAQSSDRHRLQVRAGIERAIEACEWDSIADISADSVQRYLAKRHKRGKGDGPRTLNLHRAYLRAFTRWLTRNDRLAADPLASLDTFNEAVDVRRSRRPFTDAELAALLRKTPQARRMFYLLLASTGLRSKEARSLTRQSFVWDHRGGPVVIVKAAYAKGRRHVTQPLPAATAEALRPFIVSAGPGRIWAMNDSSTTRWFAKDLKAAGIEQRDDEGRVLDLHSLRHTFITRLAMDGVPEKVLQKLARHSTSRLTFDRYAHADDSAARAALDGHSRAPHARPVMKRHEASGNDSHQTNKATGTDGKVLQMPENKGDEAGMGRGGFEPPKALAIRFTDSDAKPIQATVGQPDREGKGGLRAPEARPRPLRGAERRFPDGPPPLEIAIEKVAAGIAAMCEGAA